jgi:hypothetical protein
MRVLQKRALSDGLPEHVDAGGMDGVTTSWFRGRRCRVLSGVNPATHDGRPAWSGSALRYRRYVVRNSGPSPDSAACVRAGLAVADRLRRSRDRKRRAWRGAPFVAAFSLCAGLIGVVRHWSGLVPPALLAAGFVLLIAYGCLTRRTRNISDAVAAAIDRDAGLDGELRSAHWFAARDTRDHWADFHVDRAADRIASFDWASVYPPPRDRRAQVTTGGIAIAALLLPLAVPGLSGFLPSNKDARHPDRIVSKVMPIGGLPVGLPKELEALLSSVENGTLRIENAAQAAALRALLDKLAELHGADSLKQLARAMTPEADPDRKPSTEAVMKALAERVQRAAENAALPPPLRDALENLSDDLSQVAQAERAANRDPREATPAQSPQDADAAQTNASAKADELSIQAVRDADAGGGAAILMVADPNGSGTDPGTGLGGGSGAEAQQGRMADIARALRREIVEANENSEGSDALTDLRRKSERGHATVTFTGSGTRTFDSARVSGPPAVPEARRAAIQSYFVRKQ